MSTTAKSKTRTSSSIPVMRATGGGGGSFNSTTTLGSTHAIATASPSNLPASHIVTAIRSDKLEEEAARMEARLAALKVAMTSEKAQRANLKRTKAGTFWKGANPVEGAGKSYIEDVMQRVERRVARANSGATSTRTPAANSNAAAASASSQSQQPLTRAALASHNAATNLNSNNAATVGASDTASRSSYAPPVRPKSNVSATSAPRVQGASTAAATIAAGDAPRQPSATAAASSSHTPSTFVNPADDETRSGAPGSLLDGDFDEQENKQWFAAAREEWMAQQQTGGATTTTKTQLVHDPDYSPSVEAESDTAPLQNSLLDGPAFNERESAKEFAEARRAWIQSLEDDKAGGGGKTTSRSKVTLVSQAQSSTDNDGMWNPSIALGEGGSILFPSDTSHTAVASSGDSQPAVVSAALRQAQSGLEKTTKSSCYTCYKLFYTSSGVTPTPSDFPASARTTVTSRHFCSNACMQESLRTFKLRCDGVGCTRSLLLQDGRRVDEKFFCNSCANNDGVAVSPQMPPPIQQLDADASPEEEEPADGSDADEQGTSTGDIPEAVSPAHASFQTKRASGRAASSRPLAENAQAVVEAPDDSNDTEETGGRSTPPPSSQPQLPAGIILARPPTAALSRPATAAPVVLDTTVIRQAPQAASASAAVVEYPSSDEDDV